jgi:hypothetical protein
MKLKYLVIFRLDISGEDSLGFHTRLFKSEQHVTTLSCAQNIEINTFPLWQTAEREVLSEEKQVNWCCIQ